MTNKTFEQLNMELINRGLVYKSDDMATYDESQWLEGIYPWGFIIGYACNVLPTQYKLYDNEYQLMCTLDSDDDNWNICDGHLNCTRTYGFEYTHKFSYILNNGAPVHVGDVAAIGYVCDSHTFTDRRFYALNNGTIYYKEDGQPLRILDSKVTITDLINLGYTLLGDDAIQPNIDILNDMIIVK